MITGNVEEIIKDVEPLIRDKVTKLVVRKLSLWNSKLSVSDIISEETEDFMKVIRPALWRVREKNERSW